MIVSHQHRFIFLKTRKTASTSVEIALSRHCGPDDIITPFTQADEELRREFGGRGPQNYERPDDHRDLYNHMAAWKVRELVGDRVWNSYYKFTTERNPWDTVISLYFWRYRNRAEQPPASQFIQDGPLRLNSRVYRIDGEIAVDKVCLYETLHEDLEQVWKTLGLPGQVDLPRAKAAFRGERSQYRDYYTAADRARIGRVFSDVIEAFGYEF